MCCLFIGPIYQMSEVNKYADKIFLFVFCEFIKNPYFRMLLFIAMMYKVRFYYDQGHFEHCI